MKMAPKWSLILKTHLFYCLVTVITAAGWNGIQVLRLPIFISIFSQFHKKKICRHNCLLEIRLHVQCTLSLRLSVCICRYPEVLHHPSNPSAQCWVHEDGCQVKPLLHLMACKALSGVWVFKPPVPPPILSPWDCFKEFATNPHPSLLPSGLYVYICMWECRCMHMINAQNCAAALW